MNQNTILAILEHKKIITEDEAVKIAEYLQGATQSTHFVDAQRAIKTLLDK